MSSAPPPPSAPTSAQQKIAAIWQRNLPQTLDRLMQLDRAAAAAQDLTLTLTEATQARDTAHKLAGSLGMFGYPEGSRLARELEQHLQAADPDPGQLLHLTAALRAALFPAP